MSRIRLGMLTPSSNTVVEPTTNAIIASLPDVTAHYSRFKVTEISLSEQGLAQFEPEQFMAAADLLADARMDVIAWNGTSAAWRGLHEDVALCEAIRDRFSIPATTSMLALNEILRARDVGRLGLVTPYTEDVQARIIDNYRGAGFDCIAESHLGIHVNFEFSEVAPTRIAEQVRAVAEQSLDAIIVVCTNLRSAPLIRTLEEETKIPIYDSTSAVVWRALRLAKVETKALKHWGSLFIEAWPSDFSRDENT